MNIFVNESSLQLYLKCSASVGVIQKRIICSGLSTSKSDGDTYESRRAKIALATGCFV